MQRKEMIKKLGEHFGVEPKYLKAPSFTYEIATDDELYTIAKDGQITDASGQVVTFEEIIQKAGAEPESSRPTIVDTIEVTLPLEGHTGRTLLNVLNMLASKQNLLIASLGLKSKLVEQEFSEAMNTTNISSLDDFIKAYEEVGTEKCSVLKLNLEDRKFSLTLLGDGFDENQIHAFTDLAGLLNQNAKQLKKTSCKPAQDENPKYALRTWLIRLGMNGDDYKESRKVLLTNLPGSSAFRTIEKDGEDHEA